MSTKNQDKPCELCALDIYNYVKRKEHDNKKACHIHIMKVESNFDVLIYLKKIDMIFVEVSMIFVKKTIFDILDLVMRTS
jgi:hypothetical protein